MLLVMAAQMLTTTAIHEDVAAVFHVLREMLLSANVWNYASSVAPVDVPLICPDLIAGNRRGEHGYTSDACRHLDPEASDKGLEALRLSRLSPCDTVGSSIRFP